MSYLNQKPNTMKNMKVAIIIFFFFIDFGLLNAQSLTQQQKSSIESAVIDEMKTAMTPGTALAIINNNRVVYEKSFGLANLQTKTEMTDTTIFQIASVTKIFTALTLLTELKKANISLNESIGNVIKGLTPVLSSITFHQLLTHTSGMIDYSPNTSEYNISVFDFLKKHGDSILFKEPGKVFSYSNTGYAILGLLIEQLTGKSYPEAVNNAVIIPLKLHHTTFDFLQVACKSFSAGHYYDYSRGLVVPAINHYEIPLLQAAGGLFSNIRDIERLALCLMNKGELDGKQIFESEIIEKMFFRHVENFTTSSSYYGFMSYPNNAYGYGLFIFDYGSLHFTGNGGAGTQMTYFVFEPQNKFALIIISNISWDFLITSFKKIFEVVLGEKEPSTLAYKGSKDELKEIIGKYILPTLNKNTLSVAVISEKDNKTYINFDNSGDIALEQIDKAAFKYSISSFRFPIEISFYRDDSMKIAYMRNIWRSWIKIE
jgi:CubicO group peptidase (beta-lactamase class C family)